MGNANNQARGFEVARSGARADEDPFAELADIFEHELQFDQRFVGGEPGVPKAQTRQPAKLGAGDHGLEATDHDFALAFENERRGAGAAPATIPPYQANYGSAARPKPVVAARKPYAAGRPTHLTDEEIDDELEAVLRNLSTPAKPRDRIVVETQSFAPARAPEEHIPSAGHGDVDEFEELIRSELAAIRPATAATRAPEQDFHGHHEHHHDNGRYEEEHHFVAPAAHVVSPRRSVARRAATMGVSAVALLLIGGAGLAVWQNGPAAPGGSSEPLLIKADAEPYKLAPKEPGGRAYPNQNKAVYDRVAGAGQTTPMQQALLRNSEEPMDLPAEDETVYADNLPGVEMGGADEASGKDETRVTTATEAEPAAGDTVLQPRKVRTMTVGADGRLVMAEAATTPSAPPPVTAPTADAPRAAETAIPVAMTAPAQQPDPIEVAAVAPQPTVPAAPPALPAGSFFVQVASQPSEAAAQQSMQAFGTKYGGVVQGRPVGIQSAEIAGKGTYYRVRVAAQSRDEANGICSKLKSAGATCFVTR